MVQYQSMRQLELRFDTNQENPELREHKHDEYEDCEYWMQNSRNRSLARSPEAVTSVGQEIFVKEVRFDILIGLEIKLNA